MRVSNGNLNFEDTTAITRSTVFEHRSNAEVVAKGTGISLVGMVGQRGLNYLFSIVLAQAVGVAAYGLYNWAWAAVNLVKILAQCGLNQGGQRFVARFRALGDVGSERRLIQRITLFVTFWGGLVAVGLLLSAEAVARLASNGSDVIASLLRWFALCVPFSALLLVLSSFSDGQRKIWQGVLSRDIVQPATALLVLWMLLGAGLGLVGAVQAYLMSTVLAVLVAFLVLRSYYAPARSPVVDLKHYSTRAVLAFSLPFLPMTLLRQTTGLKLEIYLLGYLGSAEDVGVFSAAASTAFLISFGLNAIVRIYSTIATELHAKQQINQLERLLQTVTYWSTCLSLPGVIGLGLFDDQFLRLFGDEFSANGTVVLMILALGQLANAVTGPVGVTLTMSGYSRLILVDNLVALTLNVVLDWWLISVWGITGAAIGNTIIMTGLNLTYMIQARRLVGVWSFNSNIFRPVVASGLTILVMMGITRVLDGLPGMLQLVLGVTTTAIVYGGWLWIATPARDRKLIVTTLRQVRKAATLSGIKDLFAADSNRSEE